MFAYRSSWGALLARVSHLSEADVLFWIGVFIVIGCLVGAIVYATRAAWIVVGCLLAIALFAGVLLL